MKTSLFVLAFASVVSIAPAFAESTRMERMEAACIAGSKIACSLLTSLVRDECNKGNDGACNYADNLRQAMTAGGDHGGYVGSLDATEHAATTRLGMSRASMTSRGEALDECVDNSSDPDLAAGGFCP